MQIQKIGWHMTITSHPLANLWVSFQCAKYQAILITNETKTTGKTSNDSMKKKRKGMKERKGSTNHNKRTWSVREDVFRNGIMEVFMLIQCMQELSETAISGNKGPTIGCIVIKLLHMSKLSPILTLLSYLHKNLVTDSICNMLGFHHQPLVRNHFKNIKMSKL